MQRVLRWFQHGAAEPGVLVAVLSATLCAMLALAYQALSGYRLQERATRRALTHYASVATWEFSRSARQEMARLASITVAMPVWRVGGYVSRPGGHLPSFAAIRAAARSERDCDCPKPLPVLSYLRITLATGVIEAESEGRTPPQLTALRDRLLRYLSDTSTALQRGSDQCAVLFDAPAGGPRRAISIMVMRDPAQRAVALFAAESPIDSLRPVLDRVAHEATLLPPSILDRSAQGRNVFLAVTAGGHTIFSRGDLSSAPSIAADTLSAGSFPLVVGAGLSEGARASLASVMPLARPSWIAALLAAALALFAVAFRQLRRGAELARLRRDFVASVSHELHTPLALVTVYTETLLLERESSGDERRRFLDVILREARRLSRLVDNMMRVTESERGRLRVAIISTDLGAIVATVVDDLSALAAARSAKVSAVVTEDLRAEVDPSALRQMLLNIIGNALKFGPDCQCISVLLTSVDGEARITVDDQGPGIPRRDRLRVFERYVRLVRVEAGAPSGGGIGLSVVRELAQAQRIRVWIDDAPNGGTRVVLAMPLVDGPVTLATPWVA